jgi:single-strand DNA-binding protein
MKRRINMSQQGINKVSVLGHAGSDAELKYTAGGKPVANFSVAVNESFKNSNGDNVDRVEWFRCVAWNGLAELVGQHPGGPRYFLKREAHLCRKA